MNLNDAIFVLTNTILTRNTTYRTKNSLNCLTNNQWLRNCIKCLILQMRKSSLVESSDLL